MVEIVEKMVPHVVSMLLALGGFEDRKSVV